jgi:hydrogenase expression/formation protein HypC
VCLAIPALIKSIEGNVAQVDIAGITQRVSLDLTPEAKVGDYVIVHTGYAISLVDQEEAAETLRLVEQVAALGRGTE